MKVLILRGIPGSGKTTYAKNLADSLKEQAVRVVSADLWFERDGEYKFDPQQLSKAHGRCLVEFVSALTGRSGTPDYLVVDNTNLEAWEIAPYYSLAEAYGHDVEILTLTCSLEIAAARQVHGVPRQKLEQMAHRLLNTTLPPRWRRSA